MEEENLKELWQYKEEESLGDRSYQLRWKKYIDFSVLSASCNSKMKRRAGSTKRRIKPASALIHPAF